MINLNNINMETEKGKVEAIITNTSLNALHEEKYDHIEEAILWAKSKDYFPELTDEEILFTLRKYKMWNEFEKEIF